MTESPLERLERLEREATPGPWRDRAHPRIDGISWVHDSLMVTHDAEFIAEARNQFPRLLRLWRAMLTHTGVLGHPNDTCPCAICAALRDLERDA